MAISDYADWWDQQKTISEKFLNDWVDENPQWWTMAVAARVKIAMDMGAGTVDVLRFGEGMAEGGFKGYGQDALRLLMLLGPLGKAAGITNRFLTPLLRSGNLKLAVQVTGVDGPCTFQALNNAAVLTKGKNLFWSVGDMAAAMGVRLSKLARNAAGDFQLGAWVDELVPFLQKAGMRVRQVTGLTKLSQVFEVARNETGAVIFAIKFTVRTAAGGTEELLHAVIASRSPSGIVRFADYGGKFVNSLEQLVENLGYGKATAIELYQAGSSATIMNGARITGAVAEKIGKVTFWVLQGVTAIETNENGVEFAVPVAVVASNAPLADSPVDPVVVKSAFDAYRSRQQGKPVLRMPEMAIKAGSKTAPRADWLTGVQYRLNALGFGAGPVDGIMGPLTRAAVLKFQRTYPPLMQDGVPGPKTQAMLVKISGY